MKQATITDRNPLHFLAGRMLATCLPARREKQEQQFTIPNLEIDSEQPLADRLIRYYLGHRHVTDPGSLENLHRAFWQRQEPGDWYRYGAVRHQKLHLPHFGPIFQQLEDTLNLRDIERVVEFGCGDGRWLAWLAQQWTSIRDFQGVDLSAGQIEINRQCFPTLKFDSDDLVEWAEDNALPRSLYLTHCGVLEYLSQASIDRLLAALVRRAPGSMIAFVEPIDDAMDLSVPDSPSRPHGDEFSWSHHYPGRLRAAGCRIEQQQEVDMDGYRMLVVIGKLPPAAKARAASVTAATPTVTAAKIVPAVTAAEVA